MSLSVCMIARNESSCIDKAIKSILPIADEIIVVDTGSTDNTVEIVENLIGRCYRTKWEDDFAKARNVSLSLATKEWVLWLDCDDIIPFETLDVIKNSTSYPENIVYVANVKNINPANTNIVKNIEFPQARLFRNNRGIVFKNRIHEQITESAKEKKIPLIYLADFVIEHYGYIDSVKLEKKRERNISIMLKQLGYPENEKYYTFYTDGYYCVYYPNVVTVFHGLRCVGSYDVDQAEDQEKEIFDTAKIKIILDKMKQMYKDFM